MVTEAVSKIGSWFNVKASSTQPAMAKLQRRLGFGPKDIFEMASYKTGAILAVSRANCNSILEIHPASYYANQKMHDKEQTA